MASSNHTANLRPIVDKSALSAAQKTLDNAARDRSVRFKAQADMAAPLRSFDLIDKGLGRITGGADQFSESMGAANARVLAFGASVGIMNAVADAIKNVVNVSIEVEHSMKQLEIITGVSTATMSGYKKELFGIATDTASSFEKTSQTMLEFSRAGLSGAEALNATSTAMKFAKISGADMETTIQGLMASYQAFNKEGLNYVSIADKISAADISASVNAKDLADAMSRSAQIVSSTGISFDNYLGMITAVAEKTKESGSKIGNFSKRLVADLVQPETKNYIETELGVKTTNAEGGLRPFDELMKEIAEVTKGMENTQEIAQKIAGAYNVNFMDALIKSSRLGSDGLAEFERNAKNTINSAGGLDSRISELNETLLSSIERIKTMGVALADAFGNSGVTDTLKVYANKLEEVLKFFVKSDDAAASGENFGKIFGQSLGKAAVSSIVGIGIQAAIAGLLIGSVKLVSFAFEAFQTFTGIATQQHKINNLAHFLGDTLSKNADLQRAFFSYQGNSVQQAQLLNTVLKEQLAVNQQNVAQIRAAAAEMARLSSVKFSGGNLVGIKEKVTSYAPSKANPLNNPAIAKAVMKEIELGAVPSQIRVGQQGKFRNAGNPHGYVVTNTRDEPTGHVPNHAFISPKNYSQQELIDFLNGDWKPSEGNFNKAAVEKELKTRVKGVVGVDFRSTNTAADRFGVRADINKPPMEFEDNLPDNFYGERPIRKLSNQERREQHQKTQQRKEMSGAIRESSIYKQLNEAHEPAPTMEFEDNSPKTIDKFDKQTQKSIRKLQAEQALEKINQNFISLDETTKKTNTVLSDANDKLASGFEKSAIGLFLLANFASGVANTIDGEKEPLAKSFAELSSSIANAAVVMGTVAQTAKALGVSAAGPVGAAVAALAILGPQAAKFGEFLGDQISNLSPDSEETKEQIRKAGEIRKRFNAVQLERMEREKKIAELAEQEIQIKERHLNHLLKNEKFFNERNSFNQKLKTQQQFFETGLGFDLAEKGARDLGNRRMSEVEIERGRAKNEFEKNKSSSVNDIVKEFKEKVLDSIENNPRKRELILKNDKEYEALESKYKSDLDRYEIAKKSRAGDDLLKPLEENVRKSAKALKNNEFNKILANKLKSIDRLEDPLQKMVSLRDFAFDYGGVSVGDETDDELEELRQSAVDGIKELEVGLENTLTQINAFASLSLAEVKTNGAVALAEFKKSEDDRMELLRTTAGLSGLRGNDREFGELDLKYSNIDKDFENQRSNINSKIEELKDKKEIETGEKEIQILQNSLNIENQRLATLEETYRLNKQIFENENRRLIELKKGNSFGVGVQDALDNFDTRPLSQVLGNTIPNAFRDGLQGAMQAAIRGSDDLGSALLGIAASFADAISNAAMGHLADQITGSIFSSLGTSGFKPSGYSSGGVVKNGSGYKDDVPAMLTKGEFVIRRDRAQKLGYGYLNALNSGGVKGYNSGGVVSNDLFIPGSSRAGNQGAISGESDLLRFAQQQTTSGATDKITASGSRVGIDLEDQSKRLSVFALAGDNKIARDVREAQGQSFDAIFGYQSSLKQWREQREAIKKQNEAKLISSGVGLALSLGAAGVSSAFSAPKAVSPNTSYGNFGWHAIGGGTLANSGNIGGTGVGSTNLGGSFGNNFGSFGASSNLSASQIASGRNFNGYSFGPTGFANGGFIGHGSGIKDDVPAMLMRGEYVLNADAVRRIGKPKLDSMNRKMAEGGFVNESDTGDVVGGFGETNSSGDSMTKMLESIVEKLATIIQDNSNEINITINNSEAGVSAFSQPNSARGLAERIRPIVVEEMVKQKRLGGIDRDR